MKTSRPHLHQVRCDSEENPLLTVNVQNVNETPNSGYFAGVMSSLFFGWLHLPRQEVSGRQQQGGQQ